MKKPNSESTSKRTRIHAVLSSRSNNNEKKSSTNPSESSRVSSPTNNDTSGPGGGKTIANSELSANIDSGNVAAATLVLHANSTTPITSLTIPSGKSQSTSAKEFLTRRVRSRSKTDAQTVPDKSLFSKIFSKKSKKPLGTLITTTTNSIDINSDSKRTYLINKSSLTNEEAHSTIDEDEEEYGDDDALEQSAGSLSDIDNRTKKKSKPRPDPIKLPQSDWQYYASMSSAPKGFSISYHKCMTKGNDNIRLQQAAFGRPAKGSGTGGDGANQLKVRVIFFHLFLVAFPLYTLNGSLVR